MNDTYLFIDGGYLREVVRTRFESIFGSSYKLSFSSILRDFTAKRAYYYDCLDDQKKDSEAPAAFELRVEQQEAAFDEIERTPGVHVRKGWLSPGRRRQQKEVDVLFAVDVLMHSFNKNMATAVLLAGDRDFRPVVESIVRLGTYVTLAYSPRDTSKELVRAADTEHPITVSTLCQWMDVPSSDRRFHFPSTYFSNSVDGENPIHRMSPAPAMLRTGLIGSESFQIEHHRITNDFYTSVRHDRNRFRITHFNNEEKLLAYLESLYGEINWS